MVFVNAHLELIGSLCLRPALMQAHVFPIRALQVKYLTPYLAPMALKHLALMIPMAPVARNASMVLIRQPAYVTMMMPARPVILK